MKKFFSLMAVVLAAATVFTSCKKDDGSYPATLEGLYAAQPVDTVTFSLWIDGKNNAELIRYKKEYTDVDTIIFGKLTSYDSNSGIGTLAGYNSKLKTQVTASIQAQKGSTNIVITIKDESCEFRYLTKVGFSNGTWSGNGPTDIGTWNCTLSVQDDSTCTISWAIGGTVTGTVNYKIAKIYGFWNVGTGMSVGTFQFVEQDTDDAADTTYWLGFRMDEGKESYLTIMDKDGDKYPLNNGAKTQVTSALAE